MNAVPAGDNQAMTDNSDTEAAEEKLSATESSSSSNGLLLSRQQCCAEPRMQRHEKIRRYQSSSEPDLQLERLLLMSCEITAFGTSIRAALIQLQPTQEWQPEDLAFFALLKESAEALQAAEAQRYALQTQLEETIQGITHIEEAIDARGGDHRLAEE